LRCPGLPVGKLVSPCPPVTARQIEKLGPWCQTASILVPLLGFNQPHRYGCCAAPPLNPRRGCEGRAESLSVRESRGNDGTLPAPRRMRFPNGQRQTPRFPLVFSVIVQPVASEILFGLDCAGPCRHLACLVHKALVNPRGGRRPIARNNAPIDPVWASLAPGASVNRRLAYEYLSKLIACGCASKPNFTANPKFPRLTYNNGPNAAPTASGVPTWACTSARHCSAQTPTGSNA